MDRSTAEALMKLYAALGDMLNEATVIVGELPDIEEQKRLRRPLGSVMSRVWTELMLPIVSEHPDLDPDEEVPQPLPPLTAEEMARVSELTDFQVRQIDDALLGEASFRWRKVARIVGFAMSKETHVPGIPDVFYAQRVGELVAAGELESQGNLEHIRFSEVRLPSK